MSDHGATVPEDRFANLPANAVAVNSDGVYMTVKPGRVEQMGLPEFFSADGRSRGKVYLQGVQDKDGVCSYFMITNETEPRVSSVTYPVMWCMAKRATSPRFEVHTVNDTLAPILQRIGMDDDPVRPGDMVATTADVRQGCVRRCVESGWTLRDP